MKILYAGTPFGPDEITKQLLVLGNEIIFAHGPPIEFQSLPNMPEEMKGPITRVGINAGPVPVCWFHHNQEICAALHQKFLEADAGSRSFRETVIEGVRGSHEFALRYIPPKEHLSDLRRETVIAALANDEGLVDESLDTDMEITGDFSVATREKRQELLLVVLKEVSYELTVFMVASDELGTFPVTGDRFLLELLHKRLSSRRYVGTSDEVSFMLGLEAVSSVVPDHVLRAASVEEIGDFRAKAKDAYHAWAVEMERLSQKLEGSNIEELDERRVRGFIRSEISPRLVECSRAMEDVRDDMFRDLLKDTVKWHVPALLVNSLAGLGFAGALGAFSFMALKSSPRVIDYFSERRKISRRNAMSYLLALRELSPRG